MTKEQQIIYMARIMHEPWVEVHPPGIGWDTADSHLFAPTPGWAIDKAERLFAAGARIVQIGQGDVK